MRVDAVLSLALSWEHPSDVASLRSWRALAWDAPHVRHWHMAPRGSATRLPGAPVSRVGCPDHTDHEGGIITEEALRSVQDCTEREDFLRLLLRPPAPQGEAGPKAARRMAAVILRGKRTELDVLQQHRA